MPPNVIPVAHGSQLSCRSPNGRLWPEFACFSRRSADGLFAAWKKLFHLGNYCSTRQNGSRVTIVVVDRTDVQFRQEQIESLRPLFCPKAVAVVGASRKPTSIGYRILKSLVECHFHGSVYPVNLHAEAIDGIHCYSSIAEVPDVVDLAVITTPRDAVLTVLEECGKLRIPAAIVITAGFAEVGIEGQELQQRLLQVARSHHMRIVGPNCLGLINADPNVRLNASFSPVFPISGRIAMSSQSGAVGLAVLSAARRYGLGFSTFVSVGNKADVSGNDLLEYWEQDPYTDVILLYLESFGNPRRFVRIARRVSCTKPIIAIKSGRSASGGRAAGSHTAALAAKEVAVDALFHQSGVIRVDTLEELFDVASILSQQPLPRGRRVGIVTNAGGPGILAADACEAVALVVPTLSQQLKTELAGFLPAAAGLSNPVDMIASATPEHFERTISAMIGSQEFDAMIVEYVSVGIVDTDAIVHAIQRGVVIGRKNAKLAVPVVACLMTEDDSPVRTLSGDLAIPLFSFPEAAAKALGHAAKYSTWKNQPQGQTPTFAGKFASAWEICRTTLSDRGPGWLSAGEVRALLQSAGFTLPMGGVATSADQAIQLANDIGYPVALKLASRSVVHKSEVGGVRLNLEDSARVRTAFAEIERAVQEFAGPGAFDGVLIQPMVRGAVEVVLGMTHDPSFGPLVMFGLGGIHVEVLADVCFRITPVTDRDAGEMVRSIRGFRLLEGYRGHPRCDIPALEQLILRLSGLVEAVPEISDMDLNPVMALEEGQGYVVVDARIAVAPIKS